MKKTINTNAIVFAQVKGNTKRVVATRNGEAVYVAYALLTANKPIWEALDGTRVEGEKGLYIDFATAKNAKDFIAQAITHIDTEAYNNARKTEPKVKAEPKTKKTVSTPTKAKGKKATDLVTVTLADGTQLQIKASALGIKTEPKKAPRKSKGDKPTSAPNAKASKSVKADEPKAKATPKKVKGNGKVDFSALAGKGKAANKEAAALMRAAGITDGKSEEYKAVWAEWCKVR